MRHFLRFLSYAPEPALRRRLGLWLPVCFVIGIILYFHLKSEPDYRLALAVTAVIWLLVLPLVWASGRQILILCVVALAFASSGFTIASLRSHWLTAPLVTEKRGPVRLSGRVITLEQREYGTRVTMDRLWYDNRPDPAMPDRLRLSARKNMMEGVKIGDWIRVLAVVTPITAPYYPGGFDYQRYLYFLGLTQGIGGTGFILKPPRPMHAPKSYQSDILIKIQLLRANIRDRVFQNLEGDRAAMVTALIAGDQSSISGETMQAMRDSGLAHILSISGLHIGMMGLITLFLLRATMALIPPLVLNYNIKIWALAVAVIPVTFYSILAGLDQVPVLRSLVMSLMVLVGLILGRRNFSLRVVGIAALICMLAFPDQLLGASLQMSFAAVIGLMAIGQTSLARRFMAKARQAGLGHRLIFGIAAALLTSVVATLATSPSSAYSFNRVAIYGFVSNLLVIPATDFIMIPCVALTLLLMPFGLEGAVLKLFGASIDYMIWVAKWTANLPGAVLSVPPINDGAFLAMMFGGLFICLWVGRWRWLGGIAILGGVIAALLSSPPDLVIEQNGKLIALRHPEYGTVFSRPKVSHNMVTSLTSVFFRERGPDLPDLSDLAQNTGVTCDNSGCVIDLFPSQIIWINKESGLASVCPGFVHTPLRKPILLITHLAWPGECIPKLMADRMENVTIWDREILRKAGATTVWLSTTPIAVKNVTESRGIRPWVVRPRDEAEGE